MGKVLGPSLVRTSTEELAGRPLARSWAACARIDGNGTCTRFIVRLSQNLPRGEGFGSKSSDAGNDVCARNS